MASSFPGGLDNFTNPTASDALDSATVPHADQHANANDAIEAIESTLGVNPQGGSASVVARLDAVDSTVSGKAGLSLANIFTTGAQKIKTGADNLVGLILQRNSATQTANILSVTKSDADGGTELARIRPNGQLSVGLSSSTASTNSLLGLDHSYGGDVRSIAIKQVASPTQDVIQVQPNASTTPIFKVDSAGAVTASNVTDSALTVAGIVTNTSAGLLGTVATVPVTSGGTGVTTSTGTGNTVRSASPTFTGVPTTPTAAVDTNNFQIASTAFVLAQAGSATPVVDGTAAVGTSTRFARQDHVHPTDTSLAPLASPALTGTPTTTTAAVDTNTTQIASTAFVLAQAGSTTPAANGTAAVGTSTRFARQDHVHPTDTSFVTNTATQWVSGTTYALGDLVYNLGVAYRRKVAGAGTTAPASDTTNWAAQTAPASAVSSPNALARYNSSGALDIGSATISVGPQANFGGGLTSGASVIVTDGGLATPTTLSASTGDVTAGGTVLAAFGNVNASDGAGTLPSTTVSTGNVKAINQIITASTASDSIKTSGGITAGGTASTTTNSLSLVNSSATVIGGRNANAQIFSGLTAPIAGAASTITQTVVTAGTNVVYTTSAAHNYAGGDLVTITGITTAQGLPASSPVVITAVTSTTFTAAVTTGTTGTYTSLTGSSTIPAQASITPRSAGTIGLIVRGASSQVANLQTWQNNAGSTLGGIGSDGGVFTSYIGNTSGLGAISIGSNRNTSFGTSGNASFGGGQLVLNIQNATTVPTSNPTGGGVFYVNTGALAYRGTSGTGQTILAADGSNALITNRVTTDSSAISATTLQNIFTLGTLTVEPSTSYAFRLVVPMNRSVATSSTLSMRLTMSATPTTFRGSSVTYSATAVHLVNIATSEAAIDVSAAGTALTTLRCFYEGFITTSSTASQTLIPQIAQTANSGLIVQAGAYFELIKVGTAVGAWA